MVEVKEMSKLIIEISDELHKEIKINSIMLGTTMKVYVTSILGITEETKSDQQ